MPNEQGALRLHAVVLLSKPQMTNGILQSKTYPLIIAQYELKGHPTRSESWNLVLLVSHTQAYTFELRGNTDSFTYVSQRCSTPLHRVIAYRGGCHVGNVAHGSIEELSERLREVPIVKHDISWDSQVWVLEAIKHIKSEGFAFSHLKEVPIREELAKDMARWEDAEDTVDERLLNGAQKMCT